MQACDSRFDLKVTFGGSGRAHGKRVDMSERTLRRCITLYGILASTHMVNQVSAYYKLLKTVSAKVWESSKALTKEAEARRACSLYMQLRSEERGKTRISSVWKQGRQED
jgi:hypothetical protein